LKSINNVGDPFGGHSVGVMSDRSQMNLLEKLARCKMKSFTGMQKPASIQTLFTILIDSQPFTAHNVSQWTLLLVSVSVTDTYTVTTTTTTRSSSITRG